MASPSSCEQASRTAFGIGKMRGRFDDGAGAHRGVAGLEDARADEDGFGTELAHQGGVGGRGDAAGGKVGHRQFAGAARFRPD